VHGILIQLPLPRHVEIRKVLERISVDKDVDGFLGINRLPDGPRGCARSRIRNLPGCSSPFRGSGAWRAPSANNLTARQRCSANENMRLRHFR
jgi:hypothetical protein